MLFDVLRGKGTVTIQSRNWKKTSAEWHAQTKHQYSRNSSMLRTWKVKGHVWNTLLILLFEKLGFAQDARKGVTNIIPNDGLMVIYHGTEKTTHLKQIQVHVWGWFSWQIPIASLNTTVCFRKVGGQLCITRCVFWLTFFLIFFWGTCLTDVFKRLPPGGIKNGHYEENATESWSIGVWVGYL